MRTLGACVALGSQQLSIWRPGTIRPRFYLHAANTEHDHGTGAIHALIASAVISESWVGATLHLPTIMAHAWPQRASMFHIKPPATAEQAEHRRWLEHRCYSKFQLLWLDYRDLVLHCQAHEVLLLLPKQSAASPTCDVHNSPLACYLADEEFFRANGPSLGRREIDDILYNPTLQNFVWVFPSPRIESYRTPRRTALTVQSKWDYPSVRSMLANLICSQRELCLSFDVTRISLWGAGAGGLAVWEAALLDGPLYNGLVPMGSDIPDLYKPNGHLSAMAQLSIAGTVVVSLQVEGSDTAHQLSIFLAQWYRAAIYDLWGWYPLPGVGPYSVEVNSFDVTGPEQGRQNESLGNVHLYRCPSFARSHDLSRKQYSAVWEVAMGDAGWQIPQLFRSSCAVAGQSHSHWRYHNRALWSEDQTEGGSLAIRANRWDLGF